MKTTITIIEIILILLLSILSFNAIAEESNIIYVDDDGTTNYTGIQDAIDNANDGDTIFVYNGLYHETIIIDKSVHLIGENKHNTIINGTGIQSGYVITVDSPGVFLEGFSIIDLDNEWGDETAAISVRSNDNTIQNNIIITNIRYGIQLHSRVRNNSIIKNFVTALDTGLRLQFTCYNYIFGNHLVGGKGYHDDNFVQYTGINADYSYWNNITSNHIAGNGIGVNMWLSSFNMFYKNNFINSVPMFTIGNISIITSSSNVFYYPRICPNQWKNNYWDHYLGILPFTFIQKHIVSFPLDWLRVDWHPAKEPYDITI